MPNYRRLWVPGATYFVTLVTHQRRPTFADDHAVDTWRHAIQHARQICPFEVLAGVILPDHLHLLVTLPPGDGDLSKRVGISKATFSRLLHAGRSNASVSRRKHRETEVWQRRYYDRMIRDETELSNRLDYIHFNPVKHGHCDHPADWRYSSFAKFVRGGHYPPSWMPAMEKMDCLTSEGGEP